MTEFINIFNESFLNKENISNLLPYLQKAGLILITENRNPKCFLLSANEYNRIAIHHNKYTHSVFFQLPLCPSEIRNPDDHRNNFSGDLNIFHKDMIPSDIFNDFYENIFILASQRKMLYICQGAKPLALVLSPEYYDQLGEGDPYFMDDYSYFIPLEAFKQLTNEFKTIPTQCEITQRLAENS